MQHRTTAMVSAIAVAFLGLAVGAAQPAHADLSKCQGSIVKATSKLNATVAKSLSQCAAGVRKDASKKGVTGKTADRCEKALGKVFNVGGKVGKGAVNKTLSQIDKAFNPGREVCTLDELNQLGHLASTVNAPGNNLQDFFASALIMKEVDNAVNSTFHNIGDFQQVLNSVLDETDCSSERPNLCAFSAATNPNCRTHACRLSASSGALLQPAGLPVQLQDRVAAMSFCQAPATLLDLPVDFSDDFRAVFVNAGRTLDPPPTIPGLNVTVCIDQLRGQGWCDCNGAGAPFEPDFCLDHNVNLGGGACENSGNFCISDEQCERREACIGAASVDACGSPTAAATQESDCIQPSGHPCTCDPLDVTCIQGQQCVNANNGGPCHAGTFNGQLKQDWGGSSGPGDCVLLNTISFKLLPAGICTDGVNPVGICTTPCNGGPCMPDSACTAAGGVACIDPKGPDGQACTRDDLLPPGSPTTVPFTTGVSQTTLINMTPAGTEGSCIGSANAGMNCVSDQDCPVAGVCENSGDPCLSDDGCAGRREACLGAGFGICSGWVPYGGQGTATPGLNQLDIGPGSGTTCAAYDSSSLSGLQLVGSFPALDGNQTGDTITTFTLDCQ